MSATTLEGDLVVTMDPIDQQPVGLEMTFPVANPFSFELVVVLRGFQWLLMNQTAHHHSRHVHVVSALLASLEVPLEGARSSGAKRRKPGPAQMPRSSNSASAESNRVTSRPSSLILRALRVSRL